MLGVNEGPKSITVDECSEYEAIGKNSGGDFLTNRETEADAGCDTCTHFTRGICNIYNGENNNFY